MRSTLEKLKHSKDATLLDPHGDHSLVPREHLEYALQCEENSMQQEHHSALQSSSEIGEIDMCTNDAPSTRAVQEERETEASARVKQLRRDELRNNVNDLTRAQPERSQ